MTRIVPSQSKLTTANKKNSTRIMTGITKAGERHTMNAAQQSLSSSPWLCVIVRRAISSAYSSRLTTSRNNSVAAFAFWISKNAGWRRMRMRATVVVPFLFWLFFYLHLYGKWTGGKKLAVRVPGQMTHFVINGINLEEKDNGNNQRLIDNAAIWICCVLT